LQIKTAIITLPFQIINYNEAIASISNGAPNGSAATCIADLAGLCSSKNSL